MERSSNTMTYTIAFIAFLIVLSQPIMTSGLSMQAMDPSSLAMVSSSQSEELCLDKLVKEYPEEDPSILREECESILEGEEESGEAGINSSQFAARIDEIEGLDDTEKDSLLMLDDQAKIRLSPLTDDQILALTSLSLPKLMMLSEFDTARLRKLAQLPNENLVKISRLEEDEIFRVTDLSLDKMEKVSYLEIDELEKLSNLDRAELEKTSQGSLEEIRTELNRSRLVIVNEGQLMKKRTVPEQVADKAEAEYVKADESYKRIRADMRNEIALLNNRIEAGDDEGAKPHAKKIILDAGDLLILSLMKMQSSIEASEDYNSTDALSVVMEINASKTQIAKAREAVQAAEDKEDIKRHGMELVSLWEKMKTRIRLHAVGIMSTRMADMIMEAEYMEKRLDDAIVELDPPPEELVRINGLVEEYSRAVARASELHEIAMQRLSRIQDGDKTSEDITEEIFGIKVLLEESYEELKAGQEVKIDIIRMIMDVSGDPYVFSDSKTSHEMVIESG